MSGYFVHGGTQYPGVVSNTSTQQFHSNNYGMGGMFKSEPETKQPASNEYGFQNAMKAPGNNRSYHQRNNSNQQQQYDSSNAQQYGMYSNIKSDNQNFLQDSGSMLNTSGNSFSFGKNNDMAGGGGYQYKPTQNTSNPYNTYEKALHQAANQYYSHKTQRGGGPSRGRGRGRGGGFSSPQAPSGPKPIKATEIKAYLYAWCGQRRLKPEYEIESLAAVPKTEFSCTLRISGLDYVATVKASSKKDAQTKAAWDFAENLIKQGYMKQSELPDKLEEPVTKSLPPEPSAPVGIPQAEATNVENTGDWTLENCRQRLNQFCQRERIPAEFKHETNGPEHARTFTAELEIKISWSDAKVFKAHELGKNKKQATALCALSVIRQLYKEGIIEKHGDAIKIHGKVVDEKPNAKEDKALTGVKRKADPAIEVDEKGNWTLENSKARLNIFCKSKEKPFKIDLEEKVVGPNKKVYVASMQLDVTVDGEDKKLDSSQTAASKKSASQQCALDIITQLYDLKLVEPNIPSDKKKNQRRSMENMFLNQALDVPFYGAGGMYGGFQGFGMPFFPKRVAGVTEMIVAEKHKRIYPEQGWLHDLQESVLIVEKSLKKVADSLAGVKDNDEQSTKWLLHGVMRVGRLAKGLLLKGDNAVDLVLICTEKPTLNMLNSVFALLGKFLQENKQATEKFNMSLKPVPEESKLVITSSFKFTNEDGVEVESVLSINVHFTSTQLRNPNNDDSKDPDTMLDRNSCLQSLAALRHAKWFQACCPGLPACLVTLRLLLDIKKRLPTWECLSDWALELIVEKTLVTSFAPLSEGDALRRVFSCLSSGFLLPGCGGLQDPCEKEDVDVLDSLTDQQRQDVTESAQHAMRLIVYRQAYKILGIEPPPLKKDARAKADESLDVSMEVSC